MAYTDDQLATFSSLVATDPQAAYNYGASLGASAADMAGYVNANLGGNVTASQLADAYGASNNLVSSGGLPAYSSGANLGLTGTQKFLIDNGFGRNVNGQFALNDGLNTALQSVYNNMGGSVNLGRNNYLTTDQRAQLGSLASLAAQHNVDPSQFGSILGVEQGANFANFLQSGLNTGTMQSSTPGGSSWQAPTGVRWNPTTGKYETGVTGLNEDPFQTGYDPATGRMNVAIADAVQRGDISLADLQNGTDKARQFMSGMYQQYMPGQGYSYTNSAGQNITTGGAMAGAGNVPPANLGIGGGAQPATTGAATASPGVAGSMPGYQAITANRNPYDGAANNPYLEQMGNSIMEMANRNLNLNVMPSIRSGAMGAGQYGSSRQGVAEGVAAGMADQNARQALAGLYGSSYETAQNRDLQGQMANAGNYGNMYQFNQNLARGVNTDNWNRQMQGINLGLTGYQLANQAAAMGTGIGNSIYNRPWQTLQNASGIVGPVAGSASTSTSSMSNPNNPYASFLGGASLGAGLYNQFGSSLSGPGGNDFFGGATAWSGGDWM